jgi:hypothetical protein
MVDLCWSLRKNNTKYCKNYKKCRFHSNTKSFYFIVLILFTVFTSLYFFGRINWQSGFRAHVEELKMCLLIYIRKELIRFGYVKVPKQVPVTGYYSKYKFLIYRSVYDIYTQYFKIQTLILESEKKIDEHLKLVWIQWIQWMQL